MDRLGVLFVCLGNICRSPVAEGVLRKLAADRGLGERLHIVSCGTSGWHVGEPADPGSVAVAMQNGVDLGGHRAKRVPLGQLADFDYLVCMDRQNRRDMGRIAPGRDVHLLLDFDARSRRQDVPDPWSRGPAAFEEMYGIIEQACVGLMDQLAERLREA